MREQLLGYLLEALDADEREDVEAQLKRDPCLQRELELLHESLEPLRAAEQRFEPPTGLAERTLQSVLQRASGGTAGPLVPAAREPLVASRRWSLSDLAVAAGIILAGSMLLFPAIQQSRETARLHGCENNLRQLGTALANYSEQNERYFPTLVPGGKMSAAGTYAVRLLHGGFLTNRHAFICPSSQLASAPESVYVPTPEELLSADGARLMALYRSMGGSYGYNLGYIERGVYHNVRNQGRPTFAIMADTPNSQTEDHQSCNHSGCGQNVLYEDGHVRYLTNCFAKALGDHIFLNDDGMVAAGTHANDAVIGESAAQPMATPVSQQR